jgi:hypothetical protein
MMVAEIVPLSLPEHYRTCRKRKWEVLRHHVVLSNPFVRSAPSFRPDLRPVRAVERSGGQGWPVFGPPRQRRAASLTAASTAACCVASGADFPHSPIGLSKSGKQSTSKSKITLTRLVHGCRGHRIPDAPELKRLRQEAILIGLSYIDLVKLVPSEEGDEIHLTTAPDVRRSSKIRLVLASPLFGRAMGRAAMAVPVQR